MPCDSIRITNVQWSATTDPEVLIAALRAKGFTLAVRPGRIGFWRGSLQGGYTTATHQMEIGNAQPGTEAELKRAYAEESVNASARENGWEIDWTTNESGNREATVVRGRL